MAGKTGTLGKQGWFLTFAPSQKPEVTCVVHLDHEWGHQAASVAKRVLQAYLKFRGQSAEQFAQTIQGLGTRSYASRKRNTGRLAARRSKTSARGRARTKPVAQKLAKNTVARASGD